MCVARTEYLSYLAILLISQGDLRKLEYHFVRTTILTGLVTVMALRTLILGSLRELLTTFGSTIRFRSATPGLSTVCSTTQTDRQTTTPVLSQNLRFRTSLKQVAAAEPPWAPDPSGP